MLNQKPVYIIAPCYSESKGIILFLDFVANAIQEKKIETKITLYLIDDGSTDDTVEKALSWNSPISNFDVFVVPMTSNMGHQVAIYSGMCFALKNPEMTRLIIMDSDGEDDIRILDQLIAVPENFDIVVVGRKKRSEGILFRIFYNLYKLFFFIITQKNIYFGNYCMLSRRMVKEIVENGFFIHLAATLARKKTRKITIMADRCKRLDGKSKMSFLNLVNHGFNSLIVFADELVLWFLKLSVVMILLFLSSMVYVIYEKLFTNKAILGWASVLSIGFLNAALMLFGFFIIGLLLLRLKNITIKSGISTDIVPLKTGTFEQSTPHQN